MFSPFIYIKRRSAFWALAVVFSLFGLQSATSQSAIERLVSPGKLSTAHLEQEKECSLCHESFNKKAQSNLCIDCHTEIGADIKTSAGFHGKWPEVKGAECKSCHTEHIGRGADIMGLQAAKFDHNFTDYPLVGGHKKADCTGCHKTGVAFAKAPTTCASCHKKDEPHLGRLGTACADCHAVSGWKSIRFDHETTEFALLGKHKTATCTACHKNEVWAGLKTECIDCHKSDDIHKGAFGADCASCHDAFSWTQTRFNHDTTGFRLVGKHASAECAACHGAGKPDPAPKDCISCHRIDDVHKGKNGAACADCHTPKSWKAVTFDHARTGFALAGTHKTTACSSCHLKPAAEWKPPRACIGCHKSDDTHKGLLGPQCETCHLETSWTRVTFDHDMDAGFALSGAHSATQCAACHKKPTAEASPPVSCAGCHREEDPHKGQLGDGCGQCHNDQSWAKGVRFNHEFTAFPLLGAHAGAECADCHKTKAYLDASTACVSCHEDKDVHKGRLGADCAQCHNPSDWKRWSFDHGRQTSFALTGKHTDLACAACHTSQNAKSLKISDRCVSCHTSDDKHRGAFGTSCERCHNTEAFWAVDIGR